MSMEALTLPTPEKVGHSGNVRKLGHKGYSGKLPGIIQTCLKLTRNIKVPLRIFLHTAKDIKRFTYSLLNFVPCWYFPPWFFSPYSHFDSFPFVDSLTPCSLLRQMSYSWTVPAVLLVALVVVVSGQRRPAPSFPSRTELELALNNPSTVRKALICIRGYQCKLPYGQLLRRKYRSVWKVNINDHVEIDVRLPI